MTPFIENAIYAILTTLAIMIPWVLWVNRSVPRYDSVKGIIDEARERIEGTDAPKCNCKACQAAAIRKEVIRITGCDDELAVYEMLIAASLFILQPVRCGIFSARNATSRRTVGWSISAANMKGSFSAFNRAKGT